ncbi:hypothetical protein HF086_004402 [Spodoptera exigua]|uniref:Uncharacterized protein n=1 Tax=Spodoptera exigua TaxID=7107 RepID=A0A922MEA7_SPOEX|nr:hypothetical protein HF086_004402 [Spodoptera exigua]
MYRHQFQGPSKTQQAMRALPRADMSTGFRIPVRNKPQNGPVPMSGISHPVARDLPLTRQTDRRQEALLQLDGQHYLVTFPKPTRVQINCGQEEHRLLNGSYFATVPKDCSIRTSEFTIVNTNDKVRGNAVELMSLPQFSPSSFDNNSPRYNLTTIDLNKLHDIQHQILLEKPIKLDTTDITSTYHIVAPLYGIALLSAVALIITYLIRRRQCLRKSAAEETTTTTSGLQAAAPEDRQAAIFALNVRK